MTTPALVCARCSQIVSGPAGFSYRANYLNRNNYVTGPTAVFLARAVFVCVPSVVNVQCLRSSRSGPYLPAKRLGDPEPQLPKAQSFPITPWMSPLQGKVIGPEHVLHLDDQ